MARGEKEPTKYSLRPCPKTRPSTFSSTRPNCAGASSATTRNSKANSASPISKGEAGAASIITQLCASPLMDSLSANERQFPLRPPARQTSHISTRPRPRGAADPTRTAYRKLDRDNPKTTHGRAGPNPLALPVLPSLPSSTTYATTTTLSWITRKLSVIRLRNRLQCLGTVCWRNVMISRRNSAKVL